MKPIGLILLGACSIFAQDSTCYGTTSRGRLESGVQLPSSGPNFESYSSLGEFLGRTYVHSTVRDIVVEAYQDLAENIPSKVFKYAETGFENGGQFKPHKTHQNGLSVDFMVPVLDPKGISVHLPTHMFNKYGYSIEFDANGRFEDLTIDFKAMAAHIVALHKHAKAHGVEIWRVIFDPKLQPFLMKSSYGDYLRKHINFSTKRAWERHDEHYHVDFKIPCKPM